MWTLLRYEVVTRESGQEPRRPPDALSRSRTCSCVGPKFPCEVQGSGRAIILIQKTTHCPPGPKQRGGRKRGEMGTPRTQRPTTQTYNYSLSQTGRVFRINYCNTFMLQVKKRKLRDCPRIFILKRLIYLPGHSKTPVVNTVSAFWTFPVSQEHMSLMAFYRGFLSDSSQIQDK